MVGVQVDVAKRVHKLARFQVAHLRHHHGQQRVRGDVERHAQKGIRRPLVELAIQSAVVHVKLEQAVARRQRHLIDETRVPRGNDVAAGIRVGLDLLHQLGNLVGVGAVGVGPTTPLVAVDRTEVAVLIGPFVPNPHAVVLEVLDVGIALQKPQQLMDDGAQVQFFGGQHRKAFLQIKAHLVAKTPDGTSSCAVFAQVAVGQQMVK